MRIVCWITAIALMGAVLAVWLGLGKTGGKPIDAGFVFLDGRYIEAPYTVSHRGTELVVNDVVARRLTPWPLRVCGDPGDPQGLTEHSSPADVGRQSKKKLRYLRQHFSREIVVQKMAEYYRKCPCVASVVPGEHVGDLIVTYKNGTSIPTYLGPFTPLRTEDDVRKRQERYAERLEQRLQQGDCYFFFSESGQLSLGSEKVCKDLKVMVAVLRSRRAAEDRRALLERLGFLLPGIPGYDPLVTNFQASQQLDRRLDALIAKSGVTPRTLDEIPVIPPALEPLLRISVGPSYVVDGHRDRWGSGVVILHIRTAGITSPG